MFCKPNLIVEPLVNNWYAWPYLISPVSYSLIMTNHHQRMLQSFLRSPEQHKRMASRMLGGPFVDHDVDKKALVSELFESTNNDNQELAELAKAIKTLSQLCMEHNRGDSLDELYQKIPDCLRGYVELGYDLYNNLSPRLFEGGLYKSQYYKPQNQSLLLYLDEGESRPFILSTPRFASEKSLQLRLPFDHELVDRLAKMRYQSDSSDVIDELMRYAEPGSDRALLASFFTETKPVERKPVQKDDDVTVRYMNHATVMFSYRDCHVLTDPILATQAEGDTLTDRWTFNDLPEQIDYVILTHNHQDHVVFETLLQLRHKIKHIVIPKGHNGFIQDPSLKLILQHTGFNNIIEISDYDELPIPNGKIVGLPFLGEHGDLQIATKLTYCVEFNEKRFFVGADANNLSPEMFNMSRQILGDVPHVFVGMECKGAPMSWLYGPLLQVPLSKKQDEMRRLNGSNAEKAKLLSDALGAKNVFVYAMGAEPWLSFISSIDYEEDDGPIVESDLLIEQCKNHDIHAQRLYGKAELFF